MRLVAVLLWFAVANIAAADVADTVNKVRAQSCPGAPTDIQPLRSLARLDDAARRMANGASLEQATNIVSYPAKISASIRIRTLLGERGLPQALAQQFCDIVGDPRLTEVGVFAEGAEFWFVLAVPFTPADSTDPFAMDARALELVNIARQQSRLCGRKEMAATIPVSENVALKGAAQSHADDLAANSFLGHEGSDGSRPGDRAQSAGYDWSTYGENVAAGQTVAEEVVAGWLTSAGHCETLMNPRYVATGIAHAVNPYSDKGTYWVQIFAAPRKPE